MHNNDYFTTRAREFVIALTQAIPHLQFRAYLAQEGAAAKPDLFLVGSTATQEVLGVYGVAGPYVGYDFAYHVDRITEFFRNAWVAREVRFYPVEVEYLYALHQLRDNWWHFVG